MTRKPVGFDKAYQEMHRPDAFLHKSTTGWAVMPIGPVTEETAKQIIAQANVVAQNDGLFGDSQTWRISSAPAPAMKFETAIGIKIPTTAPCKDCGDIVALITEGTPPHAAALRCADCGRFHRWLSVKATKTLAELNAKVVETYGEQPTFNFSPAPFVGDSAEEPSPSPQETKTRDHQ
jgi:hypothetical protein